MNRRRVLQTLLAAGAAGVCAAAGSASAAASGPLRILHVMSYHSGWAWNRDQFNAFRAALADLDVEYRVVEMDAKRRSDPEWLEEIGAEARALMDSWQPDLVYTNDGYAQEYFVQRTSETGVSFVFSAVNADPARCGFDSRDDVTGVVEQEHFVQTVRLLREVVPVRRIAVLMDEDPTWIGVMDRMRDSLAEMGDIEVVNWDELGTFDAYKHAVAGYQDQVDALAVLGVFNLKGGDGVDTPWESVLRWTADNSRLPDFSFWSSRVELGTLAAVALSGIEQGRMAGDMARAILVDGASPAEIPVRSTLRGQPFISLARGTPPRPLHSVVDLALVAGVDPVRVGLSRTGGKACPC